MLTPWCPETTSRGGRAALPPRCQPPLSPPAHAAWMRPCFGSPRAALDSLRIITCAARNQAGRAVLRAPGCSSREHRHHHHTAPLPGPSEHTGPCHTLTRAARPSRRGRSLRLHPGLRRPGLNKNFGIWSFSVSVCIAGRRKGHCRSPPGPSPPRASSWPRLGLWEARSSSTSSSGTGCIAGRWGKGTAHEDGPNRVGKL